MLLVLQGLFPYTTGAAQPPTNKKRKAPAAANSAAKKQKKKVSPAPQASNNLCINIAPNIHTQTSYKHHEVKSNIKKIYRKYMNGLHPKCARPTNYT